MSPPWKSSDNQTISVKSKLLSVIGWFCLGFGILLYIVPLFYEWLGHQSGLVAFILIFIGISLLKYRKDQITR